MHLLSAHPSNQHIHLQTIGGGDETEKGGAFQQLPAHAHGVSSLLEKAPLPLPTHTHTHTIINTHT